MNTTVLHARFVLPIIPENTVLTDHAVVIEADKILQVLPSVAARAQYASAEHIELGDKVLMPGLINAHGHAAMTLLRGYADDLALMDWLQNHIWPAEGQFVSDEFVYDGTLLAIAEMIKSGTTTFSDMYFFPEACARATIAGGLRAQLSFPIFEFPSSWGTGPDDYLAKGRALFEQYKNSNHVFMAVGPHAPYTVGDNSMSEAQKLASEYRAPLQIHLHETQFEVDTSVSEMGVRPVERLRQLGLLGPLTQCVHMTALNEDDIKAIAESGSHIVHCPESNLKLASGFCPVDTLQKAGVNVALGTDGCASNNDLDMWGEVRTASMLAKAVAQDPTALNAHASLRMATINGARALNKVELLGSLEAGKLADIIAIDVDQIESLPLFDIAAQLVYTNTANRVTDVWVGGKQVLKAKQLTALDEQAIKNNAKQWQAKIAEARQA